METMQTLLTRRCVRAFKPDMVSKDLIEKVAQAGIYAPNSRGMQSTVVLAVTNKDVREQFRKVNAQLCGDPSIDPFYGAPVLLVVVAKKDIANRVYDGALVMGNMMNAAHALGLASCWIHRAQQEFEMDEFKKLLKDQGIDEEYEGIAHLALGYAAEALPKAADRLPHRIKFID